MGRCREPPIKGAARDAEYVQGVLQILQPSILVSPLLLWAFSDGRIDCIRW